MATYRERRMAKAERLREWSGKREEKAAAALDEAHARADMIPFGQPILVGHHSEGRDRRFRAGIENKTRKGFEHADKAKSMASRADNIEAAANAAIYDDDPDAIERLTERVEALEAKRARIKGYNASCRKGAADLSLLLSHERASIEKLAQIVPYQVKDGAFPKYVLSNLGQKINTNKKRLVALQAEGGE